MELVQRLLCHFEHVKLTDYERLQIKVLIASTAARMPEIPLAACSH